MNNELSISPDGDCGVFLRGRLDGDGNAIVDAALAPLMTPRADTGEGPDLRSTGRRRVEALVELCRRAPEQRDRGCAFPGCDRPLSWCEGHHIKPWALGGTTSLANGVLLCRHHHRLVEHGDWHVKIHTDGLPIWRPPPWTDPDQPLLRNRAHHPHQTPVWELASW